MVTVLQRLIDLNGLKDQIEPKGAFAWGSAPKTVFCVCIDGERFKVQGAECGGVF